MDNKRFVVFVVICLTILVGWQFAYRLMAEKFGWDIKPQTQQVAATPASTTQPEMAGGPGAPAPATAGAVKTTAGGLHILTSGASSAATLGSSQWKDPTWSMGVNLQPQGASISEVALNQFPRSLEHEKEPYVFQESADGVPASMTTAFVRVNGQQIDLGNANWQLVEQQPQAAIYAIEIGNEKPALRISKRIEIQPTASPTGGYEALVRHTLTNLSGTAMEVVLGVMDQPSRRAKLTADRSQCARGIQRRSRLQGSSPDQGRGPYVGVSDRK